MSDWLPLMDYSNKHKVSLSTLRRRIKAEDIKYRLEDGKYFIMDEEMPAQDASDIGAGLIKQTNLSNETVLESANRLLNELKRAYTQILQEKEEQILQLKEELADLKTLVRVLESENERLNKK